MGCLITKFRCCFGWPQQSKSAKEIAGTNSVKDNVDNVLPDNNAETEQAIQAELRKRSVSEDIEKIIDDYNKGNFSEDNKHNQTFRYNLRRRARQSEKPPTATCMYCGKSIEGSEQSFTTMAGTMCIPCHWEYFD